MFLPLVIKIIDPNHKSISLSHAEYEGFGHVDCAPDGDDDHGKGRKPRRYPWHPRP
jgi:hypothetical protein